MEHLCNNPRYRDRILGEWRKLQNGERVSSRIVREPIYSSWLRCRKWKVDPELRAVHSIPREDLALLLEEESLLLGLAAPVVAQYEDVWQKSGKNLVLANARGIILKIFNYDGQRNGKAHPGDFKREILRGTAALSTALHIREPVEVVAAEHYRRAGHNHACVAAPIFDSGGDIAGAIGMTSGIGEFHPLMVPLIRQTAQHISGQLMTHELLARQKTLIEMTGDAILIVNRAGAVITANSSASSLLGSAFVLPGTNVGSLGLTAAHISQIRHGRAFHNESVRIQLPGHSSLSCSISFVPEHGGGGGTIVMRNLSRFAPESTQIASAARATFQDIIGKSPGIRAAIEQASRIARHDLGVLIVGESGTGKELFAQAIHNASPRRHKPFVTVNCGALPRDLVQAELFGYEEGAFTGASRKGRVGKFELADGGTIFLDEIGEMPLEAQVSLLRLIQNQEVVRIGSNLPRPVNVRIIAATNRDLYAAMQQNLFRKDLFYRLNGFVLRVPPLRERLGDTEELARFFLARYCGVSPENTALVFGHGALESLKGRDWPGNIRELENAIHRACCIVTGKVIQKHDLADPAGWPGAQSGTDGRIRSEEKHTLERLLAKYRGNVKEAAREAGYSQSFLYARMACHGLKPRDFRLLAPPSRPQRSLADLAPAQLDRLFRLLDEPDK